MIRRTIFILCCFTSLSLFGQEPVFEWAKQIGGNNNDHVNSIATDHLGNVYVTGFFQGTVDFDPGPNVYNLIAASNNVFAAKYDTNGQFVWAFSLVGEIDVGNGSEITTDNNGNVYITGAFLGPIDFDPGPSSYNLYSLGGKHTFVLKLDTDGIFIWARNMGGSFDTSVYVQAIAVDDSGSVYTSGYYEYYENTIDFDPGSNVYNLTSNGDEDIFISKLNSDGDFVWAKSIGGDDTDIALSIALDNANNVYTTGHFEGTVDFDPGPGEYSQTSNGESNTFISKLNSDGDFIWAKNIGEGEVIGIDITIDQSGNVYTTGQFEGTVDFDPGPDQFILIADFRREVFVQKLDNEGNFAWAKSIGGGNNHNYIYSYSIATDQSGNVYTTGFFEGSVAFGPYNLTSDGSDIYILKLNAEGFVVWAGDFTGEGSSSGSSIAIDLWDNIYTTGSFGNTTNTDLGCGSHELTSEGQSDAFIHKMNQQPCGGVIPLINNNNTSFGICLGDSIVLRAAMPCWAENLSFSWNTGATLDSIVVMPDITSNYTVDVSYNLGTANCNTSVSVDISVFVNEAEVPYNGFDDDCDEMTLDDDLDQDGFNLAQDCDDNNPNIPAIPGTPCDDGIYNTFNDVIQLDGCTCSGYSNNGQTLIFEWAKQFGGNENHKNNAGQDIVTDAWGNIYFTGEIEETADFDPGPAVYNLEAGSFIAKFNASGQLIWAFSFDDDALGFGIDVDTFGNVYISGELWGTADFDPGPETYNLTSVDNSKDIFILKLDTNGTFLWARRMGGANKEEGSGIVIDNSGDVYTTGTYQDTSDFDPGPNVYNLISNGTRDIFISKLSSDGDFVWAKSVNGINHSDIYSIALDSDNNVYTTAAFTGTVDFNPGLDQFNLTAVGDIDLFVLKLDSDGNFIWVKSIGSYEEDVRGISIAVDENGNVITIGYFSGTVDFDPGPGSNILTGSNDLFILKLDPNGNHLWAKSLIGSSYLRKMDMALDKDGNLYITGEFGGTMDFDPGPENYYLSAGRFNIFVLKLETNGSFIWVGSFKTDSSSSLFRKPPITIDDWNNIYTTGWFRNTSDFDLGLGVYELPSYGGSDAFIQKMSQSCPGNPTINSPNTTYTLCLGESIILTAEMPSWTGNLSYSWNTGETSDFIEVSPDSNTIYNVNVNYTIDTITCASSALAEVTVFPSAPETPIAPDDILIQQNGTPFEISIPIIPNAESYEWAVPTGVQILSGANTNSITVDWGGITTGGFVCVSAINECGSSPEACLEVTVDFTDALKDINKKGYSIFPNPSATILNVLFDDHQTYEIALYDVLGRVVLLPAKYMEQAQIEVSQLPAGTYWLKISKGTEVFWERLEVLR